MASPYASAAKIASAEAKLGGPIAQDSSLLLKQLVVALGNVTGGGGGSGTVTSVAQSFTGGLISVSGSPVTTSGTLALTVAGTSGGIPYFSSASTWASSAALAANALVVGGGAGAAPSTVTTGTGVVTALGVNVGTAGAFVVNGGALGTPSSGTLTNCTLPASGITGTLAASKGGTGVANGASCSLTLPNAATTITTGGTIALGGFTLTVPATGTTALLGTANTFTAVQTITNGTNSATPTNSLICTNSANATAGVQSASPSIILTGQGWKTNATAASQSVSWQQYCLPVQGSANPTSKFVLQTSINGGSYYDTITVSRASSLSNTALTFQGNGVTATLTGGAGDHFLFSAGFLANLCITCGNSPTTIYDRSGGGLKIGNAGDYATAIGRSYDSSAVLAWLYPSANDNLQLGLNAAGVSNQTLSAANRITSDGVGANLTIAAGNGRGAAGGSLILSTFTTAAAGTAGTLTSRLTIDTSGNIALPNVTAVTTETVVSDRTWPISINGVTYKICLKA